MSDKKRKKDSGTTEAGLLAAEGGCCLLQLLSLGAIVVTVGLLPLLVR